MFGLGPVELGVVRDRGEIGRAIARGVDEHAIEQQLDADVGDRAARTTCTAAAIEALVELAHQRGDRCQTVKHAISLVVERDSARDVGLAGSGEPDPGHRREIGQHRAEADRRRRRSPTRDRRVPEEVHASYYHLGVVVVGIDLGTQSCKAVVCDDQLAVRGHHAVGYPTERPEVGGAEQDPRQWETALGGAIQGALAAAGCAPREVAAVAVVGQLDGCVAVDRDGAPLHRAVIWEDRRASGFVGTRSIHHITGQIADPGHLAPKAAWLRARGVTAARFHQPVSYLVERLTGCAIIDPSLASTTMLCELATATWSADLLADYRIAIDQLPRIAPACAIAGTVTAHAARFSGLAPGTPVAVGTGDDFATPLGAGIIAPGTTVCAIGTAEVVGALAVDPRLDRGHGEPIVETHCYPTGGYFIENPGWLSGGAIKWATALLGLADDRALDDAARRAPPGADGVTFIPALTGAMTPAWRPNARALVSGMTAAHDRTHIARAVLEGLAFACRDVVERLTALGLTCDRVMMLGGGARSTLWAQVRADALSLPHYRAAYADTAPLAAAMIAGVACGHHPSLVDSVTKLAPPELAATPERSLDEAYTRYREVAAQVVAGRC